MSRDLLVVTASFVTAPTSRDVWVCPAGKAYRLKEVRYVYATVASTATAMTVRKNTGTAAPGAAAGATTLEVLGATGTGTEDMTAAINTVRTPALINSSGSGQTSVNADNVLRFKGGDRLSVAFSSAATALAGLVGVFTFIDLSAY